MWGYIPITASLPSTPTNRGPLHLTPSCSYIPLFNFHRVQSPSRHSFNSQAFFCHFYLPFHIPWLFNIILFPFPILPLRSIVFPFSPFIFSVFPLFFLFVFFYIFLLLLASLTPIFLRLVLRFYPHCLISPSFHHHFPLRILSFTVFPWLAEEH